MKTLSIQLYSFSELSADAQQHAIDRERELIASDYWSLDFFYTDVQASIRAITEACNLRVADYSYGPYCQNYKLRVTGWHEDDNGPRAVAWFLRILIKHGYARTKRFKDMQFPGVCGFTGVCYDDDIVETIYRELIDGETVRRAFDAVSYRLCKIAEDEMEDQCSPENIRERLESDDDEIFTSDGERY